MINDYVVTWRDSVGLRHFRGFTTYTKARAFAVRLECAGLFDVEVQ